MSPFLYKLHSESTEHRCCRRIPYGYPKWGFHLFPTLKWPHDGYNRTFWSCAVNIPLSPVAHVIRPRSNTRCTIVRAYN
jgi:hypothetical protein